MAPTPIDRERWERIEAILDEVLELPAGEWSGVLDRTCGRDPELRAEVEGLLAADAAAGEFLKASPDEVATWLLTDPEGEPTAPPDHYVGRELGPYRVVRRIGGGGMGLVYEARDTRLGRKVALKLLPSEWSRDPDAKERFIREARAASALDHPNICTIHDIGETDDGRLFLVMARYEGETLAQKIARGPLPIDQAVKLAMQIAAGLERAHEAGITHRDVKPANVMVTDRDEVKILDFGIAKIAGHSQLTQTGKTPGTPAYMSPEHAGGGEVDGRTDIWSLGVILYEMIAGRRPFQGQHDLAVIYAILSQEPDPLSRSREGVPAALEQTVTRALAKDPAERFQQAGQLLAVLGSGEPPPRLRAGRIRRRRVVGAVAALIGSLLVIAGWWAYRELDPPVPMVGVIPFDGRSGNLEHAYGEAIAQLVTDALSRSRYLRVVPREHLHSLAPIDSRERMELAAQAGIRYLVTGEIDEGPEGPIVAARLIDVRHGRQLAACRIEPRDRFQAADRIATETRKGLGIPIAEAVDVFAADFATESPEAYESYLEGLRAFTDYRNEEAEHAFTAALEQDPEFTMARYRLAHVQATNGRTDEAEENIAQAVLEASELPEREAGYVRAAQAYFAREYPEAIIAYRRIIDSYPYETEARYHLAQVLFASKRYQEELEVIDELASLEPQNHITWSLKAQAHFQLGQYGKAFDNVKRYVELEPGSANGHHLYGDVYRALEEYDSAANKYAEALKIDPQFHCSTVELAKVNVLRDRSEEAERQLYDLVSNPDAAADPRIDAAFELAALYRSAGRFRAAESLLEGLEELIAREKVREAQALAVRGTSRMEIGDIAAAGRLITHAVERSPGPPTRYLFARGLLELRRERLEELEETARQILAEALPPEDPDRAEEKAAAYLRGMRRLAADEVPQAIAELGRAVTLNGYEYAVYRLGLARAYLKAGRLDEALAAAKKAQDRDPAAPRPDLDLDRTRALLVLARVQHARGHPEKAAESARQFLKRWSNADRGLQELDEARGLAGE